MLRIGPEPTDNEISTINIRQDNKRIGILKNPNGKYSLDVSGTINCGALTVNGIRATFDGTNSGLWSISDTDTISYVDGSVGIGTEEPAHELDVSGSVNCSELLVNGTAPTFGGEYVLYDDTYQTSGVSYEEVSANITTTSSGVWDLSDSNTISYTNGNVGIGTTDPAYELDVSGNIYANENIYANGRMYIYDSYLTLDNSVTGATNGIHIKMKHKDATHDARALVVHQDTADILQINYDYDFDTVRINNTVFIDGSCGIGTASPQSLFHVRPINNINDQENSFLDFRADWTSTNNGFLGIYATQTHTPSVGSDLRFKGSYYDTTDPGVPLNTQVMCLKPNGYVGIGLTDPAYELDVLGNIGIRGSGNGIIGKLHGSLVIQSQGNGTGEGLFLENINRSNNDMNISINILTDDGIHFNVNDTTDRMYINETGVGIGTTSHTAPLYVLGNSSPCVIVKYPGNSVPLQEWQYLTDSGSQRGMTLYSPGDWSSSALFSGGPANTFIFRTADAFSFYTDDNHVCHMGSTGIFYVWNFVNYSDDRLKSNEIPITDALTTIMKLNPMTYDKYNNMDKSGNYFRESGLISQDIWYQVPELRHIVSLGSEYKDGTSTVPTPIDVSNNELLEDTDYNNLGWSTTEPSSVKYLGLIAYLIKAVQELNIQRQEEKDALQASHDSLQASHDSLQASHDSLQTNHDSLQTSHDSLQASHDSLKDEMAELKALLQEKSVI